MQFTAAKDYGTLWWNYENMDGAGEFDPFGEEDTWQVTREHHLTNLLLFSSLLFTQLSYTPSKSRDSSIVSHRQSAQANA